MLPMSRVRRQHFVNEAYLNHFCDESLNPPAIWVYEKQHDYMHDFESYNPVTRTPRNICVVRDFYEGNDQPVNTIENFLSKIEGDFESVVQNTIIPQKPLSSSDKYAISRYFTVMQYRTMAHKEHIDRFYDDIIGKITALEQQHNAPNKESKKWKKSKENKEMFLLNLMMSEEMNVLRAAGWLVLINDTFRNDHFITSDHATLTYDFSLMNSFYGIPAFCKTTEITLPITPKIALVANYLDINEYESAHPNQIEEVNQRTWMASNGHIYSSRKLEQRQIERLFTRHRQGLAIVYAAKQKKTHLDRMIKRMKRGEKIAEWLLKTPILRHLFIFLLRFLHRKNLKRMQ